MEYALSVQDLSVRALVERYLDISFRYRFLRVFRNNHVVEFLVLSRDHGIFRKLALDILVPAYMFVVIFRHYLRSACRKVHVLVLLDIEPARSVKFAVLALFKGDGHIILVRRFRMLIIARFNVLQFIGPGASGS